LTHAQSRPTIEFEKTHMGNDRKIRCGLINRICEKAFGKQERICDQQRNRHERKLSQAAVTQHGLKGHVKGSKLDSYKPEIGTMRTS
jgi:hypothetical protein